MMAIKRYSYRIRIISYMSPCWFIHLGSLQSSPRCTLLLFLSSLTSPYLLSLQLFSPSWAWISFGRFSKPVDGYRCLSSRSRVTLYLSLTVILALAHELHKNDSRGTSIKEESPLSNFTSVPCVAFSHY